MKITKVIDRVFHVNCNTQRELTQLFIRLEEHYESPQFKGKIFTLGEYRAWYAKEYGAWTYYTDWDGFNIPGSGTVPFRTGLFDPLSAEEKLLLGLIPHQMEEYYIIGTYGNDTETLDHEIAHAMYSIDPEYKSEVNRIIQQYKLKELKTFLLSMGYHKDVLNDECNAYLAINADYLDKEEVSYSKKLASKLNKLYTTYYSKITKKEGRK